MIYSPKILKACELAKKVHRNQRRKVGLQTPYISHPITVGLILARIEPENEDLICAGILHDVVEDSEKGEEVTLEDIKRDFGDKVHSLVAAVTEKDRSLSWEERKKSALEEVKSMNREELLLKSADILQNKSESLVDFEKYGLESSKNFSRPLAITHEKDMKLLAVLEEKWPKNPLLPEIKEKLKELETLMRFS